MPHHYNVSEVISVSVTGAIHNLYGSTDADNILKDVVVYKLGIAGQVYLASQELPDLL